MREGGGGRCEPGRERIGRGRNVEEGKRRGIYGRVLLLGAVKDVTTSIAPLPSSPKKEKKGELTTGPLPPVFTRLLPAVLLNSNEMFTEKREEVKIYFPFPQRPLERRYPRIAKEARLPLTLFSLFLSSRGPTVVCFTHPPPRFPPQPPRTKGR